MMITNIVGCPGESAQGTGLGISEPFPGHLGIFFFFFLLSCVVLIMVSMNLAVLLLELDF